MSYHLALSCSVLYNVKSFNNFQTISSYNISIGVALLESIGVKVLSAGYTLFRDLYANSAHHFFFQIYFSSFSLFYSIIFLFLCTHCLRLQGNLCEEHASRA